MAFAKTEAIVNDRFHYFDIRGSPKKISWGQLVKFPSSLLTELVRFRPSNSVAERIFIDRDPKHFDTVVNLMRHGDPIYAAHLRRTGEFTELLNELDFYDLADLKRLIIASRCQGYVDELFDSELEIVYADHESYIEGISRPLVVVGYETLKSLKQYLPKPVPTKEKAEDSRVDPDGPNLLTTEEFACIFDREHYDVKVFSNGWPGSPFKTSYRVVKESFVDKHGYTQSRNSISGANQLSLHMPDAKYKLKLLLDKQYSDLESFREQIYEFLLAADLIIRHPCEYYLSKFSNLKHIELIKEPEELVADDNDDQHGDGE